MVACSNAARFVAYMSMSRVPAVSLPPACDAAWLEAITLLILLCPLSWILYECRCSHGWDVVMQFGALTALQCIQGGYIFQHMEVWMLSEHGIVNFSVKVK